MPTLASPLLFNPSANSKLAKPSDDAAAPAPAAADGDATASIILASKSSVFDPAASRLFFFHNGTGAPPPDTLFEVPTLLTLLRVNATQAAPVRNLTIAGLGFKDSAPSYMQPHAIPSGGDWGLSRLGAILAASASVVASALLEALGVLLDEVLKPLGGH